MYEIRSQNKSSSFGAIYHSCAWKSEVKVDDTIVVKIHENPADDNSKRRGLVAAMNFNRI